MFWLYAIALLLLLGGDNTPQFAQADIDEAAKLQLAYTVYLQDGRCAAFEGPELRQLKADLDLIYAATDSATLHALVIQGQSDFKVLDAKDDKIQAEGLL